MTKRDYLEFAKAIKVAKTNATEIDNDGVLIDESNSWINFLQNEIADIFAANNPHFNREKFIKACEV